MSLKNFRSQYPQYDDIPDDKLLQSLHSKFYSDIPFNEFTTKLEGLSTEQPQQPEEQEGSGFFRRAVADPLVSLGQGVLGLKEAAVGIADIPTMGYAGKAVEAVEEAVLPPKMANLSQTLQELNHQNYKPLNKKYLKQKALLIQQKRTLKTHHLYCQAL